MIVQVMDMLLNGTDEVLLLLKKQYKGAKNVSIETNPVGFFVDFEIDEFQINSNKFENTFQIGDVAGDLEHMEDAVGFILFVKDGFLKMLEGYTNASEEWPDNAEIRLRYDSNGERNFEKLQKKWIKKDS